MTPTKEQIEQAAKEYAEAEPFRYRNYGDFFRAFKAGAEYAQTLHPSTEKEGELCNTLFTRKNDFKDATGCIKEKYHDGHHLCRTEDDRLMAWEADNDCNCEDCKSEDISDHCMVYWEVKATQPQEESLLTSKCCICEQPCEEPVYDKFTRITSWYCPTCDKKEQDREMEESQYKSPYPSEVTYRSDKNFIVRLKAMIEKTFTEMGYSLPDKWADKFDSAEDYFFASKTESASQSATPTQPATEEVELYRWVKASERLPHTNQEVYIRGYKGCNKGFIRKDDNMVGIYEEYWKDQFGEMVAWDKDHGQLSKIEWLEQASPQPSKEEGELYRWVKAEERLPAVGVHPVRITSIVSGSMAFAVGLFSKDGFEMATYLNGTTLRNYELIYDYEVEWLEQASPQPQPSNLK